MNHAPVVEVVEGADMEPNEVLEVRDAPDNCPHCGAILTESGAVDYYEFYPIACMKDGVVYYMGDSVDSKAMCAECGEELSYAGSEAE